VNENLLHDAGIREERQHLSASATLAAPKNVEGEDTGEECGPVEAAGEDGGKDAGGRGQGTR